MQRLFLKLTSQDNPLAYFYIFRFKKAWNALRFRGLKTPQNGWPILMGISIPKSGTHLLSQVLSGFSRVAPVSPHEQYIGLGARLDAAQRQEKLERQLKALQPLDLAMAHLPAGWEEMALISAPRFLPYFIFRDPRDVAVSLSHFAANDKGHRLQAYYSTLPSFDEQLMVSIQGVRVPGASVRSIFRQFQVHIPWMQHPDVHSVRFEDLIENRRVALGGIADHFLRRVDTVAASREETIDALETFINPSKSSTFRSGKTGEWKKYFKEEHKRAFKDVAGDLLVELGYEKNNEW